MSKAKSATATISEAPREDRVIKLLEVIGNTNPRNPLSKEMQKMDIGAFRDTIAKNPKDGSETVVTCLWKLGTSKVQADRDRFVSLIRENDPDILGLADQIALEGLLQPIEVRETANGYIINFGARRALASLYNFCNGIGDGTIEAKIIDISEVHALNRGAMENIRKQPDAMEEARAMKIAFDGLVAEGLTRDEAHNRLARTYGTHPNTIRNRISLLKCDTDLQDRVAKGTLKPMKALEMQKARKSGENESEPKPGMRPRKEVQELYDNCKDLTKSEKKLLGWILKLEEEWKPA